MAFKPAAWGRAIILLSLRFILLFDATFCGAVIFSIQTMQDHEATDFSVQDGRSPGYLSLGVQLQCGEAERPAEDDHLLRAQAIE